MSALPAGLTWQGVSIVCDAVNRRFHWLIICTALVLGARYCPAPIIFRPGEGWTYEPVGQARKWERNRAKEQLQAAQEAFEKKDYRTTLKAARRVVRVWPLSDFAGPAQYLIGRAYEERHQDEKAFKEFQRALTKYPKITNYPEIVGRQMAIANRFLGGQWFKLWGYIPFFPSMDRTAGLFDQIVKNGPFHETGPVAQMSIGAAREKQKNFQQAVIAYEKAADTYFDRQPFASDALFKAGIAWNKQSRKAEYDQSTSARAIDTLNQFKALYPNDKRVPDATAVVLELKTEQARGAYETGRFYERYNRYQGAIVYYNEVLIRDPKSPYAEKARARIQALRPLAAEQRQQQEVAEKARREATRRAAGLPASGTNAPVRTNAPASNPR
jgi:outer membrane protein assembly factor BamD